MSDRSIPVVSRAWWSAAQAELGREVRITAALEPGAAPAEAEVAVEACYAAGAAGGGGFAVVPVTTLRVPVPPGAACIDVPWTVAFPAEEPEAAGIPELRARVSIAGGRPATSPMLSVGAVEGVRWLPPDGGELPEPMYGAMLQAVFVPGEQVGMRLDSRGLAGCTADFTIRRGGEAVGAVTEVPLGPDGATAWWSSAGAEVGAGAYSFDVSLHHPAVAYAFAQRKGKGKAQGKGSGTGTGTGQSKQACPTVKRPTLHWTTPRASGDTSIELDCEVNRVSLAAEAKLIYTEGPPADISGDIIWLRCRPYVDAAEKARDVTDWQAAGADPGDKPGDEKEIDVHHGASYDYVPAPGDADHIKIKLPRNQRYGYPTKRGCKLIPVCKPWKEREKRGKALLDRYGVKKSRVINDPLANLFLMSAVVMNETNVKGSRLERECIAYVMLNRARAGFNGKTSIHDVVFDMDGQQIYSAIGKSQVYKMYTQEAPPGGATPTPSGPELCAECLAYKDTLDAVAKVLADPEAKNEYWLTKRPPSEPHRHAYYWFARGGEPARGYDIDFAEPTDFLHSFWGSTQFP